MPTICEPVFAHAVNPTASTLMVYRDSASTRLRDPPVSQDWISFVVGKSLAI